MTRSSISRRCRRARRPRDRDRGGNGRVPPHRRHLLRALAREPETLEAFHADVRLLGGEPRLDAQMSAVERLVREVRADPTSAAAQSAARALSEALAVALQASLLLRFAPSAVADAFCATRLGGRGFLYGSQPIPGAAAIVRRHADE